MWNIMGDVKMMEEGGVDVLVIVLLWSVILKITRRRHQNRNIWSDCQTGEAL